MDSHDIFLVFVEGAEGNQGTYAEWFAGSHMTDMRRLPGVFSANAFRLESLDDHAVPAQLCAIYETDDGPAILATIAKAKGTEALPASDIQGKMVWRVLEGREAREFGTGDSATYELICMFTGPYDADAEDRVIQWISANSQGIGAIRQTRLSPVQPFRGSDYASVLFVRILADGDAMRLVSEIAAARGAADARFLLASPIG